VAEDLGLRGGGEIVEVEVTRVNESSEAIVSGFLREPPGDLDDWGVKEWHFRPPSCQEEKEEEYDLFCRFAKMPPETRGVAAFVKTENITTDAKELISVSRKNKWKNRANARDHWIAAIKEEKAQVERNTNHMQALESHRDKAVLLGKKQVEIAQSLLDLCNNSLEEITNNIRDGQSLSPKVLFDLLPLALKAAEAGEAMSARALGVEELMRRLDSFSKSAD
jgi:hypothetical protein